MSLNVDQHFVDRKPERERFARMLSGESDKRVLRVLVPPGHGKSWFVTRLFFDCEARDVPVVWLDFDARRSSRPVNGRYVVERCLELLGEERMPQTRMLAAEWRQAAPSPETDARYLPAAGRALRDDLSHWTTAPVANDPFTHFETGITTLLATLGQTHPRYWEVLNFQTRLIHQNIAPSRSFGDTEARRAERNEIIVQINRFTLDVLDTTFDSLCHTPVAAAAPPPPIAVLLDTFEQMSGTVREWLSGWLFDGLRRDLAHVRVVVAGRPEPSCCTFFDEARLWGRLVDDIGTFAPMPQDAVLEYYRRRGCSLNHVDTNTVCFFAQKSAGIMAQLGDTLPQAGGN